MVKRQPSSWAETDVSDEQRVLPGITGPGHNGAVATDDLGNARARYPHNDNPEFRCAHRPNASVQIMLGLAPRNRIHRRKNERLGSLPNQFVCDTPVAAIITNADANLAPRRIPHLLLARRQAVV